MLFYRMKKTTTGKQMHTLNVKRWTGQNHDDEEHDDVEERNSNNKKKWAY